MKKKINKKILSLEMSSEICSVSLLNNGTIHSIKKNCYLTHSKNILPMIKKIVNISKIKINQLRAISFSKGPGNFSGIRISNSVALGISLGINNNVKVIGISTLLIMAEQAWRKYKNNNIVIIFKSYNNNFFYYVKYIKKENFWINYKKKLLNKKNIMYKLNNLSKKWNIYSNKNIANVFEKKIKILHPTAIDAISLSILYLKKEKFFLN
ncbi:tRNA (adenosine(37)-N6)-threonylcarbamoyltransferase complex dimerization subunit type 1 TsaB [Buchnera aphidicola (Taiwanaphis decaspermi)]|uniref:tRNA (adenosine(37)-N6)-threonylcarbamoyltransferase complex dimerization subunit type 1 TsaB n=1 Tax=Buchnera aphidicola TaxID=9 RepID=UPI0031B8A0D2